MNQRIKVTNSYVLKFLLGNNLNIVEILLETVNNRFGHEKLKQFIKYKNIYQNTPLHQAGRTSNVKLVEALKIAYNEKNKDGWIALHDAAHHGEFENVKVFVQHDLNCVNELDNYKRTALHEAAYAEYAKNKAEDYFKIINYLLDHGSKIDAQDKDGFTALHSATRCGHLRIVQILIERGANINIVDNNLGATPFYIAIVYGHFEIVKYLSDKKASIDLDEGLVGISKIKAVHLASILPESLSQGIEIFEFLLKNNSDVNAKAKTSAKFLQKLTNYILSFPYVERYPVAKLFQHKIFSYFVPTVCFTPHDIASWLGNNKLVDFIENHGGKGSENWIIGAEWAKKRFAQALRSNYLDFQDVVWPFLNREVRQSSGVKNKNSS
jgi:hypothetical protein